MENLGYVEWTGCDRGFVNYFDIVLERLIVDV